MPPPPFSLVFLSVVSIVLVYTQLIGLFFYFLSMCELVDLIGPLETLYWTATIKSKLHCVLKWFVIDVTKVCIHFDLQVIRHKGHFC